MSSRENGRFLNVRSSSSYFYVLYLLLLFDDWRRTLVGYGRGDLLGVSYEESMIWHRLPQGRQQSSAAPWCRQVLSDVTSVGPTTSATSRTSLGRRRSTKTMTGLITPSSPPVLSCCCVFVFFISFLKIHPNKNPPNNRT